MSKLIERFIQIQKSGPTNPEWMISQLKLAVIVMDTYNDPVVKVQNDVRILHYINLLETHITALTDVQADINHKKIEEYIFLMYKAELKIYNWKGKITDQDVINYMANKGFEITEVPEIDKKNYF